MISPVIQDDSSDARTRKALLPPSQASPRWPKAYTWHQLTGAGALAGVGFTMSLFIAGQAFPRAEDFAVAKIAVFAASMLSAVLGTAVLWRASA